MYLERNTVLKLARVLDSLSSKVMLIDLSGQVIYPEDINRELTLPEALIKDPTTPLVYGGFTLMGTDEDDPMFVCVSGTSEDVKNLAIMCCELINAVTHMSDNEVNDQRFLRNLLTGDVSEDELLNSAAEYGIKNDRERCVILFRFTEDTPENALNILKNVVDTSCSDLICEVNRHAIALIKTVGEQFEYEDTKELAEAVVNSYLNETSLEMTAGIGDPQSTLSELNASYRQASDAILIGKAFKSNLQVFKFCDLLLERYLYETPLELAKKYHELMFGDDRNKVFNDEMLTTINTFFENNLNLSETARQLFIHRNTLVYRLDKIQRAIGLDLRSFDNAVTFKLMLMLGELPDKRKKR